MDRVVRIWSTPAQQRYHGSEPCSRVNEDYRPDDLHKRQYNFPVVGDNFTENKFLKMR